MQKLVADDPEAARKVLSEKPALCAAMLQAQSMFGMLRTPIAAAAATADAPMPLAPAAATAAAAPSDYGGVPRSSAPPPHAAAAAMGVGGGGGIGMVGSRPPAPPGAAAAAPSGVPEAEDAAASMRRVFSMSDADVAGLPPEQRESIVALRGHMDAAMRMSDDAVNDLPSEQRGLVLHLRRQLRDLYARRGAMG